jgi:hypothetical protein
MERPFSPYRADHTLTDGRCGMNWLAPKNLYGYRQKPGNAANRSKYQASGSTKEREILRTTKYVCPNMAWSDF